MTKTFFSLTLIAALSGCTMFSTPGYECSLDENPNAKCASMEQAYAAMKHSDPKVKSTSVFEAHASTATNEDNKPFFEGKESEMPEPGQQGMPVFAQPQVHRVWVAPYVDADGNLRTGEYTYFNTPGKWNYGTTKAPGAASGIFGPGKPGDLGFKPVEKPKAQQTPPKPASPASANGNVSGHVEKSHGATTPTTQPNSITQPYQKLTD